MIDYFNLLLPCLVPFECRYSKGSVLIYKEASLNLSDEEMLEQYSYTSDLAGDNQGERKIFYAERYGGAGISFHGGGARCGCDEEQFQIKGIGKNPLTSIKTNGYCLSDGVLLLSSAIYEMIWSSILYAHSPYKSVPCVAIIAINLDEYVGSGAKDYQALLIRKLCIRPAHFERSPYFKQAMSLWPTTQKVDVDRVSHMQARLQETFSLLFNDNRLDFLAGLSLFSHRQACQLASAASNLIYHSISSSNCSLDGAWLDFTSTSSISLSYNGGDAFFSDFLQGIINQLEKVKLTLHSLIFYHVKFIHYGNRYLRQAIKYVDYVLSKSYRKALITNLLCIGGVDKHIAMELSEHRDVIRLYKQTTGIITSFLLQPGFYKKFSTSIFSTGFHYFSFHPYFTLTIANEVLAMESYQTVKHAVRSLILASYKKRNISEQSTNKLLAITSTRLASWKSALCYQSVIQKINAIVAHNNIEDNSLSRAVAHLSLNIEKIADFTMSHAHNFESLCWVDRRIKVIYRGTYDDFCIINNKSDPQWFRPGKQFFDFLLAQKCYRKMLMFYAKHHSLFIFIAKKDESINL